MCVCVCNCNSVCNCVCVCVCSYVWTKGVNFEQKCYMKGGTRGGVYLANNRPQWTTKELGLGEINIVRTQQRASVTIATMLHYGDKYIPFIHLSPIILYLFISGVGNKVVSLNKQA